MLRISALTMMFLGITGCGQEKLGQSARPPVPAATAPGKQDAFAALILPAKPEKVLSVRDVLQAKEGEEVTLSGRTPPEKVKPYNDAVAAVILMDPADLERENIKTEFDCDDAATCPGCRKLLDKFGVRIEVVNQSGAVIPETLEGYQGLKPGSTLTVRGKVVRDGKDKKLVKVIATGLRLD